MLGSAAIVFKLLAPQDGLAPEATGLDGFEGNEYTVMVISLEIAVADVVQVNELVIIQLITSLVTNPEAK